MAGQIDALKILQQHLVKTGFQEKYNELVDIVIFDVENDNNGNLVFTTNTGTIEVPISIDLDGLTNVTITGATSGQALMFDGSTWVNTTIATGGDIQYIRPATSTRSGFGDVDNITSVIDALDKILYPFVDPTFSSLSIQSKPNTLELGQYLIGSISSSTETVTFNWGVTTISNISTSAGYNIIDVTDGNAPLKSAILPNTTTNTSVTIDSLVSTTNGASQVYKITGTDTQSGPMFRTKTYTWRPRRFWGTSPNTNLNSSDILGLSGDDLSGTYVQSRTFNGNDEYIWFAWSELLGDTNGFIVGNLPNSAFTKEIVPFTNDFGHTENYITYRTNFTQGGTGINIDVT